MKRMVWGWCILGWLCISASVFAQEDRKRIGGIFDVMLIEGCIQYVPVDADVEYSFYGFYEGYYVHAHGVAFKHMILENASIPDQGILSEKPIGKKHTEANIELDLYDLAIQGEMYLLDLLQIDCEKHQRNVLGQD
ncbi:MAG: hypothetical protein R3A11_07940 [Bdellovibrionota bacterium]